MASSMGDTGSSTLHKPFWTGRGCQGGSKSRDQGAWNAEIPSLHRNRNGKGNPVRRRAAEML